MFTINKELFGKLNAIKITNPKLGIEVQIISDFGAVINKYVVNNSPFSFIRGYQDYNELIEQHPFFSRSAKLFPFPNRLNHGTYQYQGDSYHIPANFPWSEHAVHGLLYNQKFELTSYEAFDSYADVTLSYKTDSMHLGYPFSIQIYVYFRITDAGKLTCTTEVINTGKKSFPFGDAWHPYFYLGESLNSCSLFMPNCHQLEHINDLPNGNKHFFDKFSQLAPLDKSTFNHCFEFEDKENIDIELQSHNKSATLYYHQDSSYPFIQLYTPADENTLAIEPMTCPADAFNNHIGLLELEPEQSKTFIWSCQAVYKTVN